MHEKRRHKRYSVKDVTGSMLFATEMRILNLSVSGAAIETDRRLNPGSEYTLKLEQNGVAITLKGVIAWSVMSSNKKGPKGEIIPLYKAGMQFSNVMTDKAVQLIEFIDRNKDVDEARLSGVRFSIDPAHQAQLDSPYTVKKISIGGMLIETEQALTEEDRFQMEIFPEDRPVRFTGRVAYCNEKNGRNFDVGIEFVEMDEESRQNLIDFVQSLYKEE